MRKLLLPFIFSILISFSAQAQNSNYWQQHVEYDMEIHMQEQSYRYDGQMEITYHNNSPESLNKIYFHLYFNAFQPGSMMDHRLANISDPDSRMMENLGTKENPELKSRIALLKENEIGYQKIKTLTFNGQPAKYKVSGTILEVDLPSVLQANEKATIKMAWEAQVPEQIRRSGRNSKDGVEFSMTQWYPKIAHFDNQGWHLDEYVAREFVAPFGNYDIKIHMDPKYVIGASGVLQNPLEVNGYSAEAKPKVTNGKAIWHFKAENILDFAWAADDNFIVDSTKTKNNTTIYAVYQNRDPNYNGNWEKALNYAKEFFEYSDEHFGAYPWPTYSIIQGGDGGMEYGTATLVTGGRALESLVNVIFHEVAHSWYQQMFGINETYEEWFDEGFTSYMETLGMQVVFEKKGELPSNPSQEAYESYFKLVKSNMEEPASLLADYYDTNYAYSNQAYRKGQVLAVQLGYIIGDENLKKTFLEFYNKWKFKHPNANDFKRVAEKISGINLKWYFNLMINTTRFVDYGIEKLDGDEFLIKNNSNFAMPIDLLVEYSDGEKELFYIPLREMRGQKPEEDLLEYQGVKRTILQDWFWTKPTYSVSFQKAVKKITIDPTKRLADINPEDNMWAQ